MIAALYTHRRCVTGRHHGEAYEKLSDQERNNSISGFLDVKTGKFVSDETNFYLKQLVLIRHGAYGAKGTDPPINSEGVKAICRIGERLAQLNLSGYLCYTSPMLRCRQTAAILAAKSHLHFIINEDIREWEDGESMECFRNRVTVVLDRLPPKALLVTHCDFILHSAYISTGESLHVENRVVPVGSVTVIHDDKILCIGQDCDVLEKFVLL